MKLHILTDLHIEFGSFTPPKTDADLVILAGDTLLIWPWTLLSISSAYRGKK